MERRAHGGDLRKGRVSLVGHAYLVTATTQARQPVFDDWRLGRQLVAAMRFHDARGSVRSLAFVVMPDHFHWLVQLSRGVELSNIVGSVKRRSAHRLGLGSIWQKGFHDRAIRREAELLPAARYLIANPVRAGLVRRVGDWPLWDAVWL